MLKDKPEEMTVVISVSEWAINADLLAFELDDYHRFNLVIMAKSDF